ncbi:MAG: ATP-binding protein, partial [bacterium]
MELFKDIPLRLKFPFTLVLITTLIFSISGGVLLEHLYDIHEEDLKGELQSVSQVLFYAALRDTTISISELELPYAIYHLREVEGFWRVVDSRNTGNEPPNELLFQFAFARKASFGLLPLPDAIRIFKTPYASYFSMKNGKEIVVLAIPQTVVKTFVKNTKRDFIMLYLLALLSMLIVSIALSDSLSRRLKRVEETIRGLNNGKFESRFFPLSADEIGSIGRGVNDLAQILSELKRISDNMKSAIDAIQLPFVFIYQDGTFESNKAFKENFENNTKKINEIVEGIKDPSQSKIILSLKSREKTSVLIFSPVSGKRFTFIFYPVDSKDYCGVGCGLSEEFIGVGEEGLSPVLAGIARKFSDSGAVLSRFAEEACKKAKEKELIQLLKTISQRAKSIQETMESVEFYALIQPPKLEELEIQREVIESIEKLDSGCKVKISVEIESGMVLKADKELFRRALLEILKNACYATRNRGEIFIRAQEKEKEIVISVVDTGEGIEGDKLNEALKPLS